MQLLDLSAELLDQIVDWTLPDGFESLTLACKTAYLLCKPRLAIHNDLRRNWRVVSSDLPITVLRQVAEIPLTSRYVKSLNLYHGTSHNEGTETRQRPSDHSMIKALVSTSPYFGLAGISFGDWWQELLAEIEYEDENGNRDNDIGAPFAMITLLLFLPKLRTLSLDHRWGDSAVHGRCWMNDDADKHANLRVPVLNALVQHARDRYFDGQSLTTLEVIHPFMESGYDIKASFGAQEWFMLMPAMKEVFSISLMATDYSNGGVQFEWSIPDLMSNVRRLELAYCNLDDNGVSNVLSRMPQLKIFHYGHESKHHGCGWEWNPGKFMEAVSRHCGATFEEIGFQCDPDPGAIENGISDFLAFKKLERLEIDILAFMGPPVASGHKRGMCGYKPEGVEDWNESELPCLATILPPSIRVLRLNTLQNESKEDDNYSVTLQALLQDFKVYRKTNLPKLTESFLRQFNSTTAKSAANAANWTFECWRPATAAGDNYALRTRYAHWMELFEDNTSFSSPV